MSQDHKRGIVGFGSYIPKRRLCRKKIFASHSWFAPSLRAMAKGERAMASFDEDSVTMGIEAARDSVYNAQKVGDLIFASCSSPFLERQSAGIIRKALRLPSSIRTIDVTSNQNAGISGLLTALTKEGSEENSLVIAADKRKTKPASSEEMRFGDAAAAICVGQKDVVARFLGGASSSHDFQDHYRGAEEEFSYFWEDRWVRDEGYLKLVGPTLKKAMEDASVSPCEVSLFLMPCPFGRVLEKIAKSLGVEPMVCGDSLESHVGDSGSSHPLLLLNHALESAKPGEKILVASFSGGVDALLFEVTDHLEAYRKERAEKEKIGVKGYLALGEKEENYMKFLAFNNLVTMEKGMRAEKDMRTALSVSHRHSDMLLGLEGGVCSHCQTPQFPKADICVNIECQKIGTQEPYSFADRKARVLSWSKDYLTYTMEPPHFYGMVDFEGGGRLLVDMTDVSSVESGDKMRMVFRIKGYDEKRGYTRYFWKATSQALCH